MKDEVPQLPHVVFPCMAAAVVDFAVTGPVAVVAAVPRVPRVPRVTRVVPVVPVVGMLIVAFTGVVVHIVTGVALGLPYHVWHPRSQDVQRVVEVWQIVA